MRKDPSTKLLILMIGCAFVILFSCSLIRHHLFQSGGYDLGIFDQSIYLISRGEVPFSTIRGIHILGDHAALILYPISLLYRIFPSVYWLFGIQAFSLALGAWPTYHLALQAGMGSRQALYIAMAYLIYPAIFNANLFDFHPEVLAVPLILAAVLALRSGRLALFCLWSVGILSCKAVLSLTIVAMGIWLLLWEHRRVASRWQKRCQVAGWIALVLGTGWFIVATFWIIPQFSGSDPAAVSYYSYLGSSVIEIARNLFLKPLLVLNRLISIDTFFYLFLLIVPLAWGLSWRHWDPLFPSLPTLTLNLLSSNPAYRDLVHHYALPIIPFLILAVIENLRSTLLPNHFIKTSLAWSCLAFLALGKYGFFGSIYLSSLDTWQAIRQAIALITSKGGVLTTHELSPHLSQRSAIYFTDEKAISEGSLSIPWDTIDYVLLNRRFPGWRSSETFSQGLIKQLLEGDEFQLIYQQNGIYLFSRSSKP